MLRGIRNSIYLWWWNSTRRVGPKRKIRLIRTYVTYGKGVTDLTWKLKYGGMTRYISERVNDYNLISTIRMIEREKLPREIERMKETIREKRKQGE